MAQGQQRAASQLLLAPLATVGDVPSGGKPLSELRNLGGTLTERTLTDPLPLGPFLGLRHGAPAARHCTLWGVHRAGAPPGHHGLQGIMSCRASWAAAANMAPGLALGGKVDATLIFTAI